jgi:hypothetical protein
MLVTLRTGEVIAYGNGQVNVGRQVAMGVVDAQPQQSMSAWSGGQELTPQTASPTPGSVSSARAPSPERTAQSGAILVAQERAERAAASGMLSAGCRAEGFDVSPYAAVAAPRYKAAVMSWSPSMPCLPVRGVKVSSSQGVNGPSRILDRDLRTRWTPAGSGAHWVACDLGTARDISSASLVWYAPRGASVAVSVEVSCDGVAFERVDEAVLSGRGTQTSLRTFVPVTARYVRFGLAANAARVSLYEIGVHGTDLALK